MSQSCGCYCHTPLQVCPQKHHGVPIKWAEQEHLCTLRPLLAKCFNWDSTWVMSDGVLQVLRTHVQKKMQIEKILKST